MLNRMSYALPAKLESAVRSELDQWQSEDKISRIWARDASVWTGGDEARWLGWLNIVEHEVQNLDRFRDFARDLEANFAHVLLMGMGGSSLAPEVLATTFRNQDFRIVDSTVPAQVKAVEDSLDLEKTLFIVASKSGSTLEPNCFKKYFFDRVAGMRGKENAGKQFVAITDPGSKLEQIAKDDGFRYIFHGDPEIGGRFSALSAFGLTAGAAMGLQIDSLLDRAGEMVAACRHPEIRENPGAQLGTILGICHRHGRDKLTIFTSPEIADLGAWLEQLIAESTGKSGVAIIPVDREAIQPAENYGGDRIFAYLSVKDETVDESVHAALKEIEHAGHPLVCIELENRNHLGQEFFRWEFATAVAGSIMGINPFDQPDVEAAKVEARKITDEYEQTGKLPVEDPFFDDEGMRLFSSAEYAAELSAAIDETSLASYLEAHLLNLQDGDYFALLAYVEMNAQNEAVLQEIRLQVLEHHGVATCLGFGPRFLHSTGQAYKGGGNNGVFLQITADDRVDLTVPGQKFTFGVVKAAQARGDFQVLLDRGRRALRVHLGANVQHGLERLLELTDHSGDVSI